MRLRQRKNARTRGVEVIWFIGLAFTKSIPDGPRNVNDVVHVLITTN